MQNKRFWLRTPDDRLINIDRIAIIYPDKADEKIDVKAAVDDGDPTGSFVVIDCVKNMKEYKAWVDTFLGGK